MRVRTAARRSYMSAASAAALASESYRDGLTNALYAPRAARLLDEFHDLLFDQFSGLFVSLSERVERGQDIPEEQEATWRRRLEERLA